jgi:hypothetical protein
MGAAELAMERELHAYAGWLEALDAIDGKSTGYWLPEEFRWARRADERHAAESGKRPRASKVRAQAEE